MSTGYRKGRVRLSTAEVAVMLGVTSGRVLQLVKTHGLPGEHRGPGRRGLWEYDEEQVRRWMAVVWPSVKPRGKKRSGARGSVGTLGGAL